MGYIDVGDNFWILVTSLSVLFTNANVAELLFFAPPTKEKAVLVLVDVWIKYFLNVIFWFFVFLCTNF